MQGTKVNLERHGKARMLEGKGGGVQRGQGKRAKKGLRIGTEEEGDRAAEGRGIDERDTRKVDGREGEIKGEEEGRISRKDRKKRECRERCHELGNRRGTKRKQKKNIKLRHGKRKRKRQRKKR